MPAAYHVIIAEDDMAVRTIVARVVARTYAAVAISATPDGLEAFNIYTQRGADLVISNHDMPLLSGLALIERLRILSATLPIVILSGNPTIEALARARGATEFLVKPFTIAQLENLLKRVLPP
jgi:two-component system capsular synthesis sensor histidine kinase RcsC